MNIKKRIIVTLVAGLAVIGVAGCSTSADVASENLSKAAEQFEIQRRVVFVNGITDTYLLSIEGRCSIEDDGTQLEVTCKVGDGAFKKHFLGLSDNVTYFIEQMESIDVSEYQYRVVFKPQVIIPDIDLSVG